MSGTERPSEEEVSGLETRISGLLSAIIPVIVVTVVVFFIFINNFN